MNKKPLLPLITFLAILIVDITSLVKGIEQHEPWRIGVCSISLVLIIIAAIVVVIGTKRQKGKQGL